MILTILIIALVLIIFIIMYAHSCIQKEKNKISIKESLDLVNIPVITLDNYGVKLNFLLDTGSSESHISKGASDMINGTAVDVDYVCLACNGQGNSSKSISTKLKHKDKEFNVDLLVNAGLDGSFKTIKDNNGVTIHGILGSKFLAEHKYILDYAEMTVYTK